MMCGVVGSWLVMRRDVRRGWVMVGHAAFMRGMVGSWLVMRGMVMGLRFWKMGCGEPSAVMGKITQCFLFCRKQTHGGTTIDGRFYGNG